jgi:hypothetical protein
MRLCRTSTWILFCLLRRGRGSLLNLCSIFRSDLADGMGHEWNDLGNHRKWRGGTIVAVELEWHLAWAGCIWALFVGPCIFSFMSFLAVVFLYWLSRNQSWQNTPCDHVVQNKQKVDYQLFIFIFLIELGKGYKWCSFFTLDPKGRSGWSQKQKWGGFPNNMIRWPYVKHQEEIESTNG